MRKLKNTILGIIASFLVSTTSVLADASAFAGPYVGVMASVNGVEFDGKHNDTNGNVSTGTVGKFAIIAGGELGYALPMSDNFLLDIGVTYVSGEAKMTTTSDHDTANHAAVTFAVENLMTAYIAPTIAITDNSAFYLKYGIAEAGVAVTGTVTNPGDLEGETIAIGTRTQMPSGLFVRTEAGMTEYDKITVTGTAAVADPQIGVNTSTTITADPTVAYGAVTVGMKF
jgi:hypothetical protein